MTDWGAHHNDVVLWCMGLDSTGPTTIEGKQTIDMIPGGYTAASEYEVTYTYASGLVHTCKSTTASDWDGSVKDRNGQQHGIKFIGTDGWLWVTRANHSASNPEIFTEALKGVNLRADGGVDHMANFIDCLKTRKDPICPAAIGHRSASICHLGTIAIRLGRKLNWDPQKEEFIGDAEASTYLSREKRKPYDDSFIA
jgi:predicted dehydrogenase